ncbi:hypothetical protein [Micromonospora sp. CPCC 206061]|uniref:hypothetical protein n=1 Tax=Micromonospora sp. CPCC 206061 TaxID=3122410 RepID=UPI002FEE895A
MDHAVRRARLGSRRRARELEQLGDEFAEVLEGFPLPKAEGGDVMPAVSLSIAPATAAAPFRLVPPGAVTSWRVRNRRRR